MNFELDIRQLAAAGSNADPNIIKSRVININSPVYR
jgi:hypothetical protein